MAGRVVRIEYNVPVDVLPEYAVLITTHLGSPTMISVTNRSVTNSARFFVNAGAWTTQMTLPANHPLAFEDVRDHAGATLMISNISTTQATLRVLISGMTDVPVAG